MYNFKEVESKWQKYWDDNNSFESKNNVKRNNLENDFIRKQNNNEIITKDLKINRLLYQDRP